MEVREAFREIGRAREEGEIDMRGIRGAEKQKNRRWRRHSMERFTGRKRK